MTPSGGALEGEGRTTAGAALRTAANSAQAPRPIKLACPRCGRIVTVYEDEVGQAGKCAGCGAMIAVPAHAFSVSSRGPSEGGQDNILRAALVETARGDTHIVLAPAAQEQAANSPPVADSAQAPVPPAAFPGRVDYSIWQGLAAGAGDWAMVARLDALRKAEQAQRSGLLKPADGALPLVLQMVLCEAAAAAFQAQGEADWRKDWTRGLVRIAARWPDDATVEGVVAVLGDADAIIAELKAAGIWPWQAQTGAGS